MKPDSQIFAEARKLLAKPERWCKGSFGITFNDDGVSPMCLMRSIAVANGGEYPEGGALKLLEDLTGGILAFNDSGKRTHSDILLVLSKAQEISEAREAAEAEKALNNPAMQTAVDRLIDDAQAELEIENQLTREWANARPHAAD